MTGLVKRGKKFISEFFVLLLMLLTFTFLDTNNAYGGYFINVNETGIISGLVSDESTREKLPGVHVAIRGSQRGTITNSEGFFELRGLEPGRYTLEFSYIGYQSRFESDVVVRVNRRTELNISIQRRIIEGEDVTVEGSFFYKDSGQSISRIGFNRDEIRRSPGSGQEISRVIQLAPGVASIGEISQDLLVRGGSPFENAFYIDGIEVPGVKHFENQDGTSNGPIGIINTEMVEGLDFYSGGFSASFGNVGSSVADIRYRRGSSDDYHGYTELNLAGIGVGFEGPLFGENGNLIFSARRSYLDIVVDIIDAGGAPRYGDIQFKIEQNLNQRHSIKILQIFGNSLFQRSDEDIEKYGYPDLVYGENNQNTTGVNLSSVWSNRFISNTSVSWSLKTSAISHTNPETNEDQFNFDINENRFTFRNVNFYHLNDDYRLEFGQDLRLRTADFDYFLAAETNQANIIRPEINRLTDVEGITSGTFLTFLARFISKFNTSIGLRANYNSLNEQFSISPRFSANYELTSKWMIHTSGGIYRQELPLFIRSQHTEFKQLSDITVHHKIVGISYLLNPQTQLTLEIYDKQYKNVPQPGENDNTGLLIYVPDSQEYFDDLESSGKGFTRGIDFQIQNKLAERFYGILGASFFKSRYQDVEGTSRSRNFDVGYILNVVGGYNFNRYWNVGVRWSYTADRPFTPINKDASEQAESIVYDMSQFNETKIPSYHSLYTRIDRNFYYSNSSLSTFLEIWNAYNRSNIAGYYWDINNNRVQEEYQFSIIPIIGIKFEF